MCNFIQVHRKYVPEEMSAAERCFMVEKVLEQQQEAEQEAEQEADRRRRWQEEAERQWWYEEAEQQRCQEEEVEQWKPQRLGPDIHTPVTNEEDDENMSKYILIKQLKYKLHLYRIKKRLHKL